MSTRLNCFQMQNPYNKSIEKWIPIMPIKEELDKLLNARFIILEENLEWVLPITITIKKNGKLWVCVDYYKFNDCTNKDYYPLPFINDILYEVIGNELHCFGDGYSAYKQIKIAKENILKMTFTTPWGTFAYSDAFWVVQCPWNSSKVREQSVGAIHRTFSLRFLGWFLCVWELRDASSWFEMSVWLIGDGKCFFEFWKLCLHQRNLAWPHHFTWWYSHISY